ncbi:MAG: hypothetical protein ACRDVL_03130 [Acidimicrobiia bacterium]
MPIATVILLLSPADSAWAGDTEVPSALADTVHEALTEWAEFASTGDTEVVNDVFAPDGPQWRQLEEEATAGVSGSGPTTFTVQELRLRRFGSETATVWVRVEAARAGFESKLLGWDFDLIRRGDRWLVWTVVEADPPTFSATPRASVPPLSATITTSTPATTSSLPDAAVGATESPPSSTGNGVRIPALSAWIVVITLAGVATAGYLAPRLERKDQQ